MTGRRRGLAGWLAVCAVAASCGGKSSEDGGGAGAAAGGARVSEAGRTSGGASTSKGGAAAPAGSDHGGAAGAAPPSDAGASAEAGAGGGSGAFGDAGAGGGTAFGGAAGAGGVGGDAGIGPGDIDADGCVDLHDWVILQRGFGCSVSSCGDPRADLAPDGWIDYLDYLVVTEHWYEGERCRTSCVPTGAGGAGGAGGAEATATDLSGDGCIGWDDLALLADSYGCDLSCAAPNTDVVPDGCVDNRDVDVWTAVVETSDGCAEDSRVPVSDDSARTAMP